jgi:ribokinase
VGRIVVLGSANMDLVVRQPRLALPGETITGSSFTTVPGGKGLNQAVAAARAGGDVAFLGAVGRDAFGDELRARLTADGVDVVGLVTTREATGTAHIAVLDGGENSIVVVPGANAAATLSAADCRAISGAGYLMAQLERPVDLLVMAFRVARSARVATVLTPAPVAPVGELLDLTDLLLPNALEARELAGVDDEAEAARKLSRRARTVVMTRGPRGALVARGGRIVAEVPARTVEPVDTTAAGDTFAGVLIARLDAGDPQAAALAAAAVAASISVTRPGASTSMPSWEEIVARL